MKTYEKLGIIDLIDPIQGPLEQGQMAVELRDNGTPFVKMKQIIDPNNPWIHTVQSKERFCVFWLQTVFKFYGLISKPCHSCWKIVACPKSLKEALEIRDLQRTLDIPSKVGLEEREYSPGLWHAFWYCPLEGGLEEARETHEMVAGKVKQVLGITSPVILKRACTEMEIRAGDSDKWVWNEEEHGALYAALRAFFDVEPCYQPQDPILQAHVIRRWIRKARAMGDTTVWRFAERESFITGPVHYNGSKHKTEDFPIFEKEVKEDEQPTRILRLSSD